MLRYQVDEIAAAHLEDPDEESALRREEDRLADASAYRDAALEALELIEPAHGRRRRPGAARAGRRRPVRTRGVRPVPRACCRGVVDLSDLARSVRDELDGWEDDPHRLGDRAGAPATAGRAPAQVRRGPGRRDGLRQAGGGPAGGARGRRGRGGSAPGRARAAPRRAGRGGGGRALGAGSCRRRVRPPGGGAPGLAGHGGRPPGGAGGARTGRESRWSWPWGPTSASRCSLWRGPRPAASWPGPCSPSGWSGWADPRPWSSTRSTPGWVVRPPWRSERPSTRWAGSARSWS